jgi:hypothetical protein
MRSVILAHQHNLPRAALLCHGVRLARITKWQSLTDGQYKFPIPDVIGKFPHFRCIRVREHASDGDCHIPLLDTIGKHRLSHRGGDWPEGSGSRPPATLLLTLGSNNGECDGYEVQVVTTGQSRTGQSR